mgnify:CR=1 FL=1
MGALRYNSLFVSCDFSSFVHAVYPYYLELTKVLDYLWNWKAGDPASCGLNLHPSLYAVIPWKHQIDFFV